LRDIKAGVADSSFHVNTSPAQFYRLLDQTNYDKSVDGLVALLQALDCEVALTVRARPA
jgi:hypothetical protein